MKSVYGLLFIFYLTRLNIYTESSQIPEYYWRNYGGLIPRDAIEGGTDKHNRPTYIAQFSVIYQNKIHTIPATLVRSATEAYGAHGLSTINSNRGSNLKILCSNDRYGYRWEPISQPFPAGCEAVVGGYEDNSDLLIGRVNQDDHFVIGKIFSSPGTHYSGLITPHHGREAYNEDYDLLIYCKSIK